MRVVDLFQKPLIQESVKQSRRLVTPPYTPKDIYALIGTLIILLAIPITVIYDKQVIDPGATLTHGPMVGAVTDQSATVWVRVKPEAAVQIEYAQDPDFNDNPKWSSVVTTTADHDYTAKVPLAGLVSQTTYYYRVWVDGEDQTPTPQPSFKAFATQAQSVKVGVLTDIVSEPNVPAPAIEALAAENPDFVIVLGDWDHRDPLTLDEMRTMHQQIRGDEMVSGATFRDAILYAFPVAHVWDDHDYGPNNSNKTFPGRVEAVQAFDEYWLTYERPNPEAGIWHRFHYGNLVEVFMLDVRSQRDLDTYQDPRYVPVPYKDPDSNRDELRNKSDRSMLDGDAYPEGKSTGQKAWLKAALLRSTARWKILASPVTWNITTPKDDAWWDFQAEWEELMGFIRENEIPGVIVVSGDIHLGGAIDDGTNAGLPEMSVPMTNLLDHQNDPEPGTDFSNGTCRIHRPDELFGCGEWSHGFIGTKAGYGVLEFSPQTAVIEIRNEQGTIVQTDTGSLSLSLELD